MCFPMENSIEKKFDHAGMQCVITRADLARNGSSMDYRCGYVRVPAKHPWHGMNYDEIDADVHGGLTFSQIEPCKHKDGQGYWNRL